MFSKSLCRVQVEQGELFLLTTLWEDGSAGMDLAITDCHKAWTGAGQPLHLKLLHLSIIFSETF